MNIKLSFSYRQILHILAVMLCCGSGLYAQSLHTDSIHKHLSFKDYKDANSDSFSINIFADERKYPLKVELYASVVDDSGYFISGLASPYLSKDKYKTIWESVVETHSDLSVQKIQKYEVEEFRDSISTPLAISLVLDYSGSMVDVIKSLETSVRDAIDEKRVKDRVAITKFDHNVNLEYSLSDGIPGLDTILTGLSGYGGGTALYDACDVGIAQLNGVNNRKILIVFTDGIDNSSLFVGIDEIISQAKKNEITFFTIGFGRANQLALEYLSTATGGKSYYAKDMSDVRNIFREILQLNKVYYRITYVPLEKKGVHKVSVSLNLGKDKLHLAQSEYNRDWDRSSIVYSSPKLLVVFPYGEHAYEEILHPRVEKAAAYLRSHPELKVRLTGHTDSKSSAAFNQRLSVKRVRYVANALIKEGVKRKQIVVKGYGKTQPLYSPDYPIEGYALENRRVEMSIIR